MPIPITIYTCESCHATFERLAGPDDLYALCLCGDKAPRRDPVDYTKYFPDWLRRGVERLGK